MLQLTRIFLNSIQNGFNTLNSERYGAVIMRFICVIIVDAHTPATPGSGRQGARRSGDGEWGSQFRFSLKLIWVIGQAGYQPEWGCGRRVGTQLRFSLK